MRIVTFTDEADKLNKESLEYDAGNAVQMVNYTTKEIEVLEGAEATVYHKEGAEDELDKVDRFIMRVIFELIKILIQKNIIATSDFSPVVRKKYQRIKDLFTITDA